MISLKNYTKALVANKCSANTHVLQEYYFFVNLQLIHLLLPTGREFGAEDWQGKADYRFVQNMMFKQLITQVTHHFSISHYLVILYTGSWEELYSTTLQYKDCMIFLCTVMCTPKQYNILYICTYIRYIP